MAEKSSKRYAPYHSSPSAFQCGSGKLQNATLMLLGKTGAGKSSLGNVILNLSGQDGFTVTNGLCATEMYEAVVKEATVNGRNVMVVDTPGVMDTNFNKEGNEEKVLRGICDGIVRCPDGVDAFLIVLRMDARLTSEEFEAIGKLETLFGSEFWRFAILVFTHGDAIDNDLGAFDDSLRMSRLKIEALDRILKSLKTKPLLVDASRKRNSEVVGGQMNVLKLAVDLLMRENQKKYSNDLFKVAQAELAIQRRAELEEKQRLLLQKVTELEDEKRKALEEERMKREALQAETTIKLEETRELTRLQKREINEKNEKLRNTEAKLAKKSKELEEVTRKLETASKDLEEASQKVQQKARRKCCIL